MTKRFPVFLALAATSVMAHAHENLALDGTLHRVLHAIGTERLVMIGGVLLAIVVGVLVRREARKAAGRRHEG